MTRRPTGSLGVRVKSHRGKSIEYRHWDWSGQDDYDVSIQTESSKRIDELLALAQSYTAKGLTTKAEQSYVEAWYHVSLLSKTHQSLNMDVRKINVAMKYASFLKSNKHETEATALLTGLWQEYQASSFAQSEEVSSRLFEVGQTLKSMGFIAVALEIFKHHSTVMKTYHKEESSSYKEVLEYVRTTQQVFLKQVSSSSGSATHISQSMMTEIITSMESSKSTQLDITSTSAVKQVVATYIAEKRWKEATTTIKQVLHVVWSSLFAASIEDIGQPDRNPEFAIELVDRIIVCYESRLKTSKAQELRERLYHAVRSTRKIDDSIVKHNLSELLRIYEKNKARDKTIQLHRELLEDYKKAYGPTHQETIKTLWTLARLTSPEPISIEYYRQIVELLSKDTDFCHPDAIDALTTIAEHYWSMRRYPEATWAYSFLFNTFVKKGKDLKQFQVTSFVSTVYERYVESLKVSTSDTTVIYGIVERYRQTCKSVFGSDTKISYEVTLNLARLYRSSKRHEAEAISLYEQLSHNTKASEYHSECRATLDAIYEERSLAAARSTNASASREQIDRAVTVIRKRFTENVAQYGWTHEESLEQLKETACLYARQSKKEEAVKQLTEATSHIISTERESTKLVKSATAIAASYIAVSETRRGLELAEELRWQLVTKDSSNSKKYNLDLTSTDRSAAIYVAQLEHSLRQDSTVSFSDIYLSILTEVVYYEEFQRTMRSNLSVEEVFAVAGRLYSFLSLRGRSVMRTHVEDQLASFFLRISGEKAKVGDVAQVKVLVITMLEYSQTRQIKTFLHSLNLASIERVRHLLAKSQHKEACDLAQTTFRYSHASGWYNSADAIKHGLILAITIADLDRRAGPTRKAQIEIASSIIRPLLEAAKQIKLNLAAIPLEQTNIIISVLGEQQDYAALEVRKIKPCSLYSIASKTDLFLLQSLLTVLWEAREESYGAWAPSVVLSLGRRLVLARFLLNKHDLALHLAADIAYNLRRVYGPAHLATLEMNILLSQLCVSTGLALQSASTKPGAGGFEELAIAARRYYKRAITVHENVLRSLTVDPLGLSEGRDDVSVLSAEPEPMDLSGLVDTDASQGTYARKHLLLLKLALERLGDFPKGYAEYEQLNADVFRVFPEELHGVEGVEKWDVKKFGNGKAESDEGVLDVNVKDWALSQGGLKVDNHEVNGVD